MIFALKFKEADVTINWLAASLTPESSPYVDALPIDEKYAQKKKACSFHSAIHHQSYNGTTVS